MVLLRKISGIVGDGDLIFSLPVSLGSLGLHYITWPDGCHSIIIGQI